MVKLRITEATLLMFYHVLLPLFGCQKTTDTIECIRREETLRETTVGYVYNRLKRQTRVELGV